ncbi:MAG: VanZ family protein [Candidatus Cloacimonetes bacterium]|nr:VanZ family protein [Candidatus Cloacimonadota bacterium]
MKSHKQKKSYSPLINLILYALLLITTPFLLLQNYLQAFIGKLSLLNFQFINISIPYIVIIALTIAIILIIQNFKYVNLFRITALIVIAALMVLGQKMSDFYFNHSYYELQHNWHYFAYGIFSFIAYKYFKSKKRSDPAIILFVFLTAISISTFDEFIQIHISNRIFDLGDIGKDTWGTIIGLVFIYFVIEQGKIINQDWKIREQKLKSYFQNPRALLVFEMIFTFILLSISSQLTNTKFIWHTVAISSLIFIIVFLIIHFSQKKMIKLIFIGVLIIYILGQGVFFLKYRDKGITHYNKGLTIYKGIPILFFDIMIFENGTFRLVDKKHDFNARDINTICHFSENILIIGSGHDGLGGNGFPEKHKPQFIFNSVKLKPLQVIILKTPEACKKFNQLKQEGYNVIFIIHNTC